MFGGVIKLSSRRDRDIQMAKFSNWFDGIAYSVLFVLYDKFDFEPEQLDDFWEKWETLWLDIKDDWLKIEDVAKVLKNECGITFPKHR